MAKKKRKPVNHKNSNYQKATREDGTLRAFENLVKESFRQQVKHAKQNLSIDAALFDGLDYGNAFRRRRNQAICATLDKVREINLDIASAVDEKYYVEKEWISVNTMAIPAYDYEEEYTSSVLGAAIWMLDQIKEAGRVQELRNILEPANELTALLVPKIWDPCHDIDLIYSMVDAICNRNKQGEMVPYTYFRRTYMTEDIAEGKVDHSNPSRYRFDSILKLIPENSITRATEYYEALYWDWVRRFYLGRQVIVRDQMMFAVDYKVAMQDTRDAARMIRSTSEQIMQRNKGSLPGCRGIDLSEKIRFDVVQYELAIQNGYRVDGNMEQLGKRKEILDKQLIDYSHLVGFIPQKTEKANVSMFGREITDAWKGFVVSNPYELCFAFLHLLDTGSDLPWCYFAGVNLHTTYCASLPWPRMVHNDACDGVWKHYHPESGDIVLGPDPEKLSKKIRVPELEDWYSLQYEHSNTESEEEAELYNLSQIMFEATGCIMPRKLDRYHPALKVLDQYGITGKRALHPLLYCMSLLGEGKHQSGPVPFHHTDFGIEPEAQEEIPEQSVEDMQAEIKRLRAEVKDLRQQAYESSREVRDEKIRYEVLAQKAANDAQELHDLRELIFNLQDEEVSSRSINLSVAFPFRTTKKIIVFGGTEAWTKEMRLKLPDVTFVDRTTMPNSEMVKRADAVWIQTNALQHSHFYKIIEDVRKYNISLRYFSSAGVTKSAEQLASHLLRK